MIKDLDHTAWKPFGGQMELQHLGAFGTNTAIMHTNRPSLSSGPKQELETSCFIETKTYQLSTHFKLYDENMAPYACNIDAVWGADDYCIVMALEYDIGTTTQILNFVSDVTAPWRADEFNFFHKIFTANAELAVADKIDLHVKGPRAGVSILMDEVKLHEYVEPELSCTQLVRNPSAAVSRMSEI